MTLCARILQVQRPGLKPLFDIDLKNLKALAQWLDKGDDARDFVGIWGECADVLYKEASSCFHYRSLIVDMQPWTGC